MGDLEIQRRAHEIFEENRDKVFRRTDRVFAVLMVAQWIFGVVLALVISPSAWEGKVETVHVHVWAALLLGGAITALPVALTRLRPGEAVTRHVIAVAQMLWSALLIHLSGGRIETHFHVFGSLAFLAFYRDWKVLVPATITVAGDHFIRGLLWPESVYGILDPEWWRFLEHAFWVVFEDVVLVMWCLSGVAEMKEMALRHAGEEAHSAREQAKSRALDTALAELTASQERIVRTEKLAAVGQLAANVGHELRNPLSAVRNAQTYLAKKLAPQAVGPAADPRIGQFLDLMGRELDACGKIIGDLLDFARERAPMRTSCPIRPLVDEALEVVQKSARVRILNEVPADLPIVHVDKDQFRQVLVNLIQNAVEAVAPDRDGTVRISAAGGGTVPTRIEIADDGAGIAADAVAKIFQPLFTTKTKGTGLGLAIVANIVDRHGGTVKVESEIGRGTRFVIELPPEAAVEAA